MFKGIDMKDILKKAQEMQKTLSQKREEAGKKSVEVSVGGGMVEIKMNGNLEVISIKIDPEIVDKNEIDILEDLIRSGVNESVRQARELSSNELADLMSDMNLPDITNLGQS